MKDSRVFNHKFQTNAKLILLVLLLLVVLSVGYIYRNGYIEQQNIANDQSYFLKSPLNSETVQSDINPIDPSLPSDFLLKDFPFQSQAPLANWDKLHDEACEEASVILVKYYLAHQGVSASEMDQQILKMVNWEMTNWGEHRNLTVKETLKMAKTFYKLNGKIISNATLDDIKYEISLGHAVIVPTAGRLLGNPNFRAPGPVYHMVVAIGYDAQNIIVQDVGTRNGDHYIYDQKIFTNAWHDWTGNESTIEQGIKNMLVLSN